MTDDKKLVDAYASIYEHHQKDADGNVIPHEEDKKEQIDEALPALAMPLLKFAGKKLLQFGANKLKQKAMSAVGNMMGRGGGPSTQAHRQNQMGMQAAHYEPEMDMVEDAEQLDELSKKTLNQYTYDAAERRGREKGIKMAAKKLGKYKSARTVRKQKEDEDKGRERGHSRQEGPDRDANMSWGKPPQFYKKYMKKDKAAAEARAKKSGGFGNKATYGEDVAITHLDGSTTEVIDVVKPEPIGNPDARLADRLWDQVASNLTTLGEMGDTRYRVEPVEEGKKAKKDYDGDGKVESGAKEYRGVIHNKIQKARGGKADGKDTSSVKENFNVKSPVSFSKPEPKKEESITEDMVKKHASSILKAHQAMTEGKGDPCWDSHKQVGMKKKGGKMVPNCVPK